MPGRNSRYAGILGEAWEAHLAPRKRGAPTVISTFAGCGGSSLGWSMAGFRELLAVEWDGCAAEVFHLNFPDVPVWEDDIGSLRTKHVLEVCGFLPGELDVLDGSPPCQGFSTAGKRVLDDPRNSLYLEFSRLLRGIHPKVFVMENVPGMVKGKMKLVFAEMLKDLKSAGYKVSARVMDMSWFSVPQKRRRMIFVGIREDIDVDPSHPVPETVPLTVRQALDGLEDKGDWKHVSPSLERYRKILSPGMSVGKIHPSGSFFNWSMLAWNKPSATIMTRTCMLHPDGERLIGISEMKRLMSFPDEFILPDSLDGVNDFPYSEKVKILGNAVPPLFMRALATHIKKTVLNGTGV